MMNGLNITTLSMLPQCHSGVLFGIREGRPGLFRTILKNRVNHGGILAPGSGVLKRGENGRGILSRWYPETLKRRILDILTIRERISFLEGDGPEVMRQNAHCSAAVFFIDPPYTASGKK